MGRTGQDVQQKQKPSRKLFINKSNESVSDKQENVPIQNNKAFVGLRASLDIDFDFVCRLTFLMYMSD